jgi:O-antigen/teichoic acid export membrane protein
VHLKAMIAYGGWVSVVTFLAPLLVTIDRLVIAAVSGPKAVTFYTVPYDLVSKSMVISRSLSSAIFPRLASVAVSESEALANRATATLTVVMTPVVIIGLFLIGPFITLWLGREFAVASSGVAELILLGVWVNALVIPNHARFMATGNPRTVALIYVLEIPIYLSMLYFGLLYLGIVGAAAAWSTRVLIDTIALLILNRALSKTLYFAAPYSLLVVSALLSVALLRPAYPAWHWATGIFLIILALYLGRDQLARSLGSLVRRQTATA